MRTFIDGLAALYTGGQANTIYDPYYPEYLGYGTNPTPKPDVSYPVRWTGYGWEKVSE